MIEQSQIDGRKYKFTDLIAEIDIENLVKIPNNEILTTGKYPVITQEQEFISGYTSEEAGLITDIPLIIFGDHTLSLKYIDFSFFFGADGIKLIKTNYIINSKYFYYLLKSKLSSIATNRYQRHYSILKEMYFNIPTPSKQKEIVGKIEKIEAINRDIELELKRLEALKNKVVISYLSS